MKNWLRKKMRIWCLLPVICLALAGCKREDKALALGEYEMELTMEGGTGKASIDSPCVVEVTEEGTFANLRWSSKNYDYMIVGGEKYLNLTPGEKSTFRVPIAEFDAPIEMIGDTTAMSSAHEITYMVTIHTGDAANGRGKEEKVEESQTGPADRSLKGKAALLNVQDTDTAISKYLTRKYRVETEYAKGFAIDEYEGGYALLTTADDGRYLVVPRGKEIPGDLADDIVILREPLDNIYVASTSAMDMFSACGGLDRIRYSSIERDSWSIETIRQAMDEDKIQYAGKYSTPDYEKILAGGCALAVENTMIYHTPQVKEQLIRNNIPVLMDYANYEETPLGRCEWVKLFGCLVGKEEEADAAFERQKELYESVIRDGKGLEETPCVVYFFINSTGQPVVRSRDDYIAAMIKDAGGRYAFEELINEGSMSTVTMTMEDFFAMGRDADVMIYNSTIAGEVQTMDDLLEKSSLLGEFDAFQKGNVYCSESNVYQASMEMGDVVKEIGAILTECACTGEERNEKPSGKNEELKFFHKVKYE